jgi:hypothetical protein
MLFVSFSAFLGLRSGPSEGTTEEAQASANEEEKREEELKKEGSGLPRYWCFG